MSNRLTPAEKEFRDEIEWNLNNAIRALKAGDYRQVSNLTTVVKSFADNPPVKPSI